MPASPQIRELVKREFVKCAADPIYFLKRYCVIQHPLKGKIPFKLYKFQENTLKEFLSEKYNIVLKGRQIGLSTLVAGYSLWITLFQSDKSVLIIATKQDVAVNLVNKVKVMHDGLPVWLRGNITDDNKLKLKFTNGSQVKAVSSSPDAGRSEALSLLLVDECAFIENVDEIWKSASSTLATGGDCILISTPNGVGNFFHKKWVEAKEHRANPDDVKIDGVFNPIFLDWKVVPGRNQSWRDEQNIVLGDRAASQEHDADFLSSGNAFVDPILQKKHFDRFKQEPNERGGFDGNLWRWKWPESGKDYMMVADVSRGDATDFSAFHVIDIESCEQVAEYRGLIDTTAFGDMLRVTGTEYNDALIAVENANVGWAVLQRLIDKGYRNMFYTEKDYHYVETDKSMKIRKGLTVAGFTTSIKTRPLILSKLDECMRNFSVIIHSERTYNELTTFIWKGNKAEAMSGYNDDLVMALSIALWIRDTALKLKNIGIEMSKKAIDNISKIDLQSTGIYVPKDPKNSYEMQVGNETESLLWLIGE